MSGTIVCDTPAKIEAYRLLSLKAMLSIEVKTGLKHSRGNPAEAIRQVMGSTTRIKKRLLDEYICYLTARGILIPKEGVTNV